MAKLIDINTRPDAKTLRQFGWIALAGFGFLAFAVWRGWLVFDVTPEAYRAPCAAVLAGIGGLSALLSLVAPTWNRPLFVGLSFVAFPIGFVVSYVVMALLFYGVVLPVGLGLRLVGKDPLDRRFQARATSYWVDARPARPAESYFKQF